MELSYSNLDSVVANVSLKAVFIAAILLLLLSIVSIKLKSAEPNLKKILFFGFVAVTVSCTLFLAGLTIYLNTVSVSRGPVHHHADYEVWRCGEELELEDPHGTSNKVGISTIHEHNDKRIHIEGVIVNPEDASLGNYFRVVGGSIDENMLSFADHHGHTILKSGDNCPDVTNAQLQVFLYKVEGENYRQSKLEDAASYIISAESNVPPGDCIIIELDTVKEKTDKLCRSFEVAKQTGELTELQF